MKIATFSVNGVNGRLPRLLEWLQEAQPDVVCLQAQGPQDRFPQAEIAKACYGAIWRSQKAWIEVVGYVRSHYFIPSLVSDPVIDGADQVDW